MSPGNSVKVVEIAEVAVRNMKTVLEESLSHLEPALKMVAIITAMEAISADHRNAVKKLQPETQRIALEIRKIFESEDPDAILRELMK